MSFKEALAYVVHMAKSAGEIQTYSTSWGNEFSVKYLNERLEAVQEKLRGVDFTKFNREELSTLGFGNWDGKLMLIPINLLPCLPDDLSVTTINDVRTTLGAERHDNDVRCGCVAYGIEVAA